MNYLDGFPARRNLDVPFSHQLCQASMTDSTVNIIAGSGPFLPVQILVVDDDAGIRRGTVRVLAQRGYTTLEADSAGAALHLLETTHVPVDLLYTEVQLPDLPGQALVERVRADWPDLPVLFVAGNADAREAAMEAGSATRFLLKPFLADDLVEAVEQLVGDFELEP